MINLSQIPEGKIGLVLNLTTDEFLNNRLAALGLKKKAAVKVLRKAKFNGPIHLQIGATEFMIRNNIANFIHVELLRK